MLYAQHKRIGGEIRSHHHTERTKIKQQKINTIYTVTSGHTRNEKKTSSSVCRQQIVWTEFT